MKLKLIKKKVVQNLVPTHVAITLNQFSQYLEMEYSNLSYTVTINRKRRTFVL